REQPDEARRFLDFALSKDAGPEVTRTAQVKLAALESPARRAPSTPTSAPPMKSCACCSSRVP
ncbi:hypothetical protein ACLESO_43020, partial [Pyxidicoccus sp. 3LG]